MRLVVRNHIAHPWHRLSPHDTRRRGLRHRAAALVSAVMNGEAELVDSAVHGTLQAQVGADSKRAWEQARQAGIDTIHKFLRR